MITLDAPRDHDDHTVADFLELLCLVNLDRQVSTDSLRDFINDNKGEKTFQLSDNQLEDVIGQIGWRIDAYGNCYPFMFDDTGRIIQAPENLNQDQKRYVSLLVCGNLPFFEKNKHKSLTDFFEHVSKLALCEIWASNGKTIAVGKNTTELVGSKTDRINALGKLLGGNPNVCDTHFRPGDQGDGGIDLAAYTPLDRWEHENIMAALAQCACSRTDWVKKHCEITNTRLRSLIPSAVPWAELLFTPISFRANSGRWAVAGDVPGVTMMDRLRILLFWMRSQQEGADQIPDFVEEFLEHRLDVV